MSSPYALSYVVPEGTPSNRGAAHPSRRCLASRFMSPFRAPPAGDPRPGALQPPLRAAGAVERDFRSVPRGNAERVERTTRYQVALYDDQRNGESPKNQTSNNAPPPPPLIHMTPPRPPRAGCEGQNNKNNNNNNNRCFPVSCASNASLAHVSIDYSGWERKSLDEQHAKFSQTRCTYADSFAGQHRLSSMIVSAPTHAKQAVSYAPQTDAAQQHISMAAKISNTSALQAVGTANQGQMSRISMNRPAAPTSQGRCDLCAAQMSGGACVKTSCGHLYHQKCLESYVKQLMDRNVHNLRCPACMVPLNVVLSSDNPMPPFHKYEGTASRADLGQLSHASILPMDYKTVSPKPVRTFSVRPRSSVSSWLLAQICGSSLFQHRVSKSLQVSAWRCVPCHSGVLPGGASSAK